MHCITIKFITEDPAAFSELMAIVNKYPSLQCSHTEENCILSVPSLSVLLDQHKVMCNRKEVTLTEKEYRILCALLYNKNQILTYDQLYYLAWKEFPLRDPRNVINTHIHNLRLKLQSMYKKKKMPYEIRTFRENGYCLQAPRH